MSSIKYRVERDIPVVADVDVLVVGGGPGGLGASVFAARAGAKTALVERYGAMGGMAFYGEIHPFMANHAESGPLDRPVYGEWIERMMGYLPPKERRPYTGKADGFERQIAKDAAGLAAEDLALDAGVDVVYHHTLTDVIREGRNIKAVVAQSKSGPVAFTAKCYVDATGDGDLATLAGNAFEYGGPTGDAQPMTLCFKLSGVELPEGKTIWDVRKEITEIYLKAKAEGRIDCPREDVLMFGTHESDVIHFNTTRIVKKRGVDGMDLSSAEKEGRRQMRQYLKLLREEAPYFGNARIRSMAGQIGVRETRRILGRAYATRQWFVDARKEPDAIARVRYPIDIHSPSGAGTELVHMKENDWYEIPYGCIVPKDVDNLTIGCRGISADHALHSSLRVMPPVVSIGQAAGLAAAWSAERGCSPSALDGKEVRAELAAMGALL